MSQRSLYTIHTDAGKTTFEHESEALFKNVDWTVWKSLQPGTGQTGDSILGKATEILSSESEQNLDASTILSSMVGSNLECNGNAIEQAHIRVAKAVSDLLKNMQMEIVGKASTMFELELVAQVCRDLSKKPGWGKREVVGKKGALRAGAWNGWRPSELFLTIQNAIPTTGEFPETGFEMNTFNRIWQRKFEGKLEHGAVYHISSDVSEKLERGDRMATYQQLTKPDWTLLVELAREWLSWYNSISYQIREFIQNSM
ncbi:hypothetical protein HD553DRAFT_325773 [Filobasidium floriforme]|uniref:uncharacterized protein n=1 Tax=Filobasidium floriforme TaxID=5210 RepID=UPI001E8D6EA6|nr:uncharacterized protein HD553DRAFT_325773 [Filobasidium floriforme]KAH8080793.1 hypothetical protein HD553DRAFT_325773 [Filobasidium floriforme]